MIRLCIIMYYVLYSILCIVSSLKCQTDNEKKYFKNNLYVTFVIVSYFRKVNIKIMVTICLPYFLYNIVVTNRIYILE